EYVYLCPLCIEQVIGICKDSIHYDQEFTLDHFPPSSVGGKNTTLVCKKCNSNTGTEFDYSLKKWLSIQQVNAKKIGTKFPVNVKFQRTEGNYKGYLIYKGEGQFEYDFPKNYPLVDNWFNKVKNGDRLWKEISISGVNQMHVSRALLKAVYLYCFSVWG